MSPEFARNMNALGVLAVCLVLVLAFYFQLVLYELPCPLCLLQRVGFVAVGFGLGLNLLWGTRARNYGIVLVAAIFGISVSIRQILLHIVPGTGHYGAPVLGLHFYTWAGIAFGLIILGTAVMLVFEKQYDLAADVRASERFGGSKLAKTAFILILSLGVANAGSALLECGPGICDDPPTDYKFLDKLEEAGET
ncbi:disulfide bond formation protein B [Ruegeria sp. HKCCD4884]|uniref:disulfide bond formation protein B n=1 Tax=Ruegeria sp. HKCCD4884 TaxID=2683022 RepID=UPI0014920BDA|nr:disulfide bond formation protein B [Ruegeria sp. HKCCD4884]NOD93193.1 disulfide bond formation protein B [Ruegeria sp. HKCCD4884]